MGGATQAPQGATAGRDAERPAAEPRAIEIDEGDALLVRPGDHENVAEIEIRMTEAGIVQVTQRPRQQRHQVGRPLRVGQGGERRPTEVAHQQ